MGRRRGNDIFSPLGLYLGEVLSNGRLVTNNAKAAHRGIGFTPHSLREAQATQVNNLSLLLYPGHQDFPHPDRF